jgi:catalase
MQMNVAEGRASYEPNRLGEADEKTAPRECEATGFTAFVHQAAADKQSDKLRMRPKLFADHYSQARLLFRWLTQNERAHVASSFTLELSEVGLTDIPPWMVGNLRNVDEDLAKRVAAGIGIAVPPKSKGSARANRPRPKPALSIQTNVKETIAGRVRGTNMPKRPMGRRSRCRWTQ